MTQLVDPSASPKFAVIRSVQPTSRKRCKEE